MKPHTSNRNRAYYRHHAKRAQLRKYRILKMQNHDSKVFERIFDRPRHFGRLRKGKVHCSCPICAVKQRTHGMKISEIKRIKPAYITN